MIQELGRRTPSGFHRYNRKEIDLIIQSKIYPVVKVASGGLFPVDETGFICNGETIWQADKPPTEEHIEKALRVMRQVPQYGYRHGLTKQLSLSDIKAKCEMNPDFEYVTNGAFIVAASKLGWKIEQDRIYGLINVSRKWWNSFNWV